MYATNQNARVIPLRSALLMSTAAGLIGALVALLATQGPGRDDGAAGSGDPGGELAAIERTATADARADASNGAHGTGASEASQRMGESKLVDEALRNAGDERAQISRSVLDLGRSNESLQLRIDELATKLAAVESTLSSLEERDLPIGHDNLPQGDVVADGISLSAENAATDLAFEGGGGFGSERRAERDILIAAGIDPMQADDIRARRNRFELERLELVDQATREGWLESERFDQQLEALRRERPDLRDELGDSRYDRFLFEQGSPNRVEVAEILDGSAASLAGMQRGDVVLSYADDRVFGTRDLQRATRDGSRGELVTVTVQRGTEVLSIGVPRGPLGVTLQSRRSPPG